MEFALSALSWREAFDVVAMRTPPRSTLYPTTARLSVEGDQEMVADGRVRFDAVRLVGMDGAVVSGVVAEALPDGADIFPAASYAETVYVYVVA